MTLTFVWKGEASEFPDLIATLAGLRITDKKKSKEVPIAKHLTATLDALHIIDIPDDSKPPKKDKVPISDETKAEILKLAASGLARKEIAKKLGIQDTRRVHGIIVGNRGIKKRISAPENVAQSTRTEENVDVTQPQQPETPTPKTQTDAIPAKAYTPAVLEGKIWDLHLIGMNAEEISKKLQDDGYYFSADAVKIRLKKMGS